MPTYTETTTVVPDAKSKLFTAYIEWDPDTRLYAGTVPGVPGAHSQGATLDELQSNLEEVIRLCLEDLDPTDDSSPRFVGVQQIEVAV